MGGGKTAFSARNVSKALQSANQITFDPSKPQTGPTSNVAGAGRGHKQKGSGNVIVAKPPVVTSDGIVLRAHERLPTQLLQEWCQREKRPNPEYYARAPGHRHTVRLPDKKDPKFDLTFLPTDTDFESVKVAKDFAALLALLELQRNMPLENKLPAPYNDSWKAMVAAAKEKDKAGGGKMGGGTRVSSAAVPAEKEKSGAGSIKAATAAITSSAQGSEAATPSVDDPVAAAISAKAAAIALAAASLDPETADWLCCGCNTQNFSKMQSGKPRTKCFKCQADRTSECEMVASTAPARPVATVQPQVTSFKIAADESPSFGFTEPKKGAADRNAGLGGSQFKMGKAAPQARLQLENKHKFNSTAEAERLQMELAAHKKRQRSYWDAVQRANRPSTVILSPQLRFQLEAVLGLSGVGLASEASETFDSDVKFSTVADYVASLEATKPPMRISSGGAGKEDGTGLISEDECSLPPGEQRAALLAIGSLLSAQGFRESAIVQAFAHLQKSPEDILDELLGADGRAAFSGGARRWQKVVLDATLEHLCLTLDNAVLPKHFDARRNEGQLQISVGPRKGGAKEALPEAIGAGELTASALSSKIVREYGWSAEEAAAALGGDDQLLPALLLLQRATLLAARQAGGSDCFLPTIDTSDSASWMQTVQDEVEMLSSIFGDTRTVEVREEGDYCTVSVQLLLRDALARAPRKHFLSDYADSAPARLDVIVHKGMRYPESPPLVLLGFNAARNSKVLLPLQLAIWQKAAELTGDTLIYQTILYLEEPCGGVVEGVLCSPLCAPETPVGIVSTLARVRAGETFLPPKPPAGDASLGSTSAEDSLSASSGGAHSAHHGKSKADSRKRHPFWSRDSRARGPLVMSAEQAAVKAQLLPSPGSRSGRERDTWLSMLKARQKLPAWNARESFLRTILQHRGMIVTGETGCGKTTQIPQFLLEADEHCKVLVCQPRRLAATGVATRVAQEMACAPGEAVGYMVRGDSACGARTRLAFCTYGVLLRRLLQDPLLDGVDYVILDEVHERGVDSDFALGLLASALGRDSCRFKLILMSATISTDKFASYLGRAMSGAFVRGAAAHSAASSPAAPILHIPGYTFAVTEYYKNDFEAALRSDPALNGCRRGRDEEDEYDGGGGGGGGGGAGARIGGPGRSGDLDYDLLVRCCMKLALGDGGAAAGADTGSSSMFERATGSVLVFLPGVPEITRFCSLLREAWIGIGGGICSDSGAHQPSRSGGRDGSPSLRIMPLHAGTPPAEQQRIFPDARPGELKIIAATNVAEASITIPDVSVVLDSCRVKETDFDPEKQMNALTLKFSSKDSLRQRRGRAGRVAAGRCFRAMTSHSYAALPNHSIPEILRTSLDALVLQIKSMSVGMAHQETCLEQLSRCPDPPAERSVAASEAMLTRMQAIDAEGKITPLGSHLAALPCAPKVGRMLVYGCLLGCALPLANVAALLSARSPFLAAHEPDDRTKMENVKMKLGNAAGGRSDQLIIVAACAGFERCSGAAAQRRFCEEHMLSFARMMEIRQLTRELLGDLATIGMIGSAREGSSLDSPCNCNGNKPRVVAAAVSAGLYPQVARIMRPPKRFEEVMGSAMEKEVSSKEMKFYVPESVHNRWVGEVEGESDVAALSSAIGEALNPRTGGGGLTSDVAENGSRSDIITDGMFRVFVHPSSIHFGNNSYGASQYVMYGETRLQPATPGRDSKSFIQDLTEVGAFPLLFFGGRLDAQYLQGTITVDGWLKFSASGKLVALIQALRRALDALLTEKIENPSVDHSRHPVLVVLADMLNSADGLR